MLQELVQGFMGSRQGQTALSRLQAQGFAPQQAQQMLDAAVPTAATAFAQARQGGGGASRPGGPNGFLDLGGSHYVTNFLSGAVSGLIRGEGLMGSAIDGAQGVVGGHVAQVLASRFGLPQRVAGTVGAVVTPLVLDYVWDRMGTGLDLGALTGGAGAGALASLGSGSVWGGHGPAKRGSPLKKSPTSGQKRTAAKYGGAKKPSAGAPISATVPGGLGGVLGQLFRS